MRKPLLVLLWLAAPAALMATECEIVPADRKDWQSEPVVARKLQTADAVFLGTVLETARQENRCTATIFPVEVLKGDPGQALTVTQYDNRYEGADEDKCTRNWLRKGGSYLFYASNTAGGEKVSMWYFPFCTLDSYLPAESAGREAAMVRRLAGKTGGQ
jgi:hypothetical protein